MRRETAFVGEKADKAGGSGGINDAGRGGGGAIGQTAAVACAPNSDTAIASERREGGAAGGDALVAGAGRFPRRAIAVIAPGEDRAIVSQRGKGLFVGDDGGVASGRGRARAAVGGSAPRRHRPVALERREGREVAELVAGHPHRVTATGGATHAGAVAGALARQQVAGRHIQLQRAGGGARGVGRRNRDVGIHRGAHAQLEIVDHAGVGVDAEARRQHSRGADRQILDRVEVVVRSRGNGPYTKCPQRLISGLPVGNIAGIKGQNIVHIGLQAPLITHVQADGQEGVPRPQGGRTIGVGKPYRSTGRSIRGIPYILRLVIAGNRQDEIVVVSRRGATALGVFLNLEIDARGGNARRAVVELKAITTHW